MLHEMTPAEFNEWMAAYYLDPWGQDWQQAGTISAEVKKFRQLLFSGLSNDSIKDSELATPEEFIPEIVFGEQSNDPKKRTDIVDIKIDEANARKKYSDPWQPLEH